MAMISDFWAVSFGFNTISVSVIGLWFYCKSSISRRVVKAQVIANKEPAFGLFLTPNERRG
jgi:hypothetical protein